ncbi:hypothetical protein C0033_03095 [Clostridium sp. chh4-2]|nr:hypothetical protein C0033_03095 [Clostridium sp. chh4-2]
MPTKCTIHARDGEKTGRVVDIYRLNYYNETVYIERKDADGGSKPVLTLQRTGDGVSPGQVEQI